MLKKASAIILLLCFVFGLSYSQENKEEKKFGIKFSGFINLQVFYDTRAMVEAREGMFTFYPAAPVFDKNGNDINDKTSLQMLAMTSRLKLDIFWP